MPAPIRATCLFVDTFLFIGFHRRFASASSIQSFLIHPTLFMTQNHTADAEISAKGQVATHCQS